MSGVSEGLRLAIDKMAIGRTNSRNNYSGTRFWTIIDNTGDELYENTIKGQEITDMDAALAAGAVYEASKLRNWFYRHNEYLAKLGYNTAPWNAIFAAMGYRAPYEFGQALAEALGAASQLDPSHVFPKGVRPADTISPSGSGMHQFGALTGTASYASVDGALDTSKIIAAAVLVVNRDATPGASGLTLVATLQNGSTKNIALTPAGNAQYQQTILGSQALSGSAAAGQKVVSLAATGNFTAAESVLIWESDALQEVVKVDTIQTNVSLTMLTNLVNSYTTAAKVYPMFTNVGLQSGTIGSGKHLDLYAMPDRVITQ